MAALDGTLGILQIAGHLNFFMFGALTIQTYVYYSSFPADVLLCKLLVAFVWTLECAHTIVYAIALYDMSVVHFGDPIELSSLTNRAWSWGILLGGLITFSVQAFFSLRLYRLFPTRPYAIACFVLTTLCFVSTTAVMGLCNADVGMTEFTERWYWLIATTLGLYALTDVAIATGLCWTLWSRKEDGMVRRTTRLIDHLLLWTLSTGLLTSIFAILALIFVFTMTDNYVYFAIDCVLYKVYSNSLLASFNSRLSTNVRGAFNGGPDPVDSSQRCDQSSSALFTTSPNFTLEGMGIMTEESNVDIRLPRSIAGQP